MKKIFDLNPFNLNQFNLKKIGLVVCSTLSCLTFSANSYSATDLTSANSTAITASGENTPNEDRVDAFDDDIYSKWLTFEKTGWIAYDFGKDVNLTKYTITSGNDAPTRDPRNWVLEGWNGSSWQTLDTRTGEGFPSRRQLREFNISSNVTVSKVRLNVTENAGANILQLSELEFIGEYDDGSGNGGGNGGNDDLPINDSGNLAQGTWKHYGPFSTSSTLTASTSGSGDADLYIRQGAAATQKLHDCASEGFTADEQCQASGNNLYVSVYAYSNINYSIEIKTKGGGTGQWVAPNVDFIDMNPETQGSALLKRIIADPAGYMAKRCIDVAQVLYDDPKESSRFFNLRFELRAKDAWGNDFVAYKTGRDGSGEMTIAVSTSHLERLYREGGNSDSAILDEIDGILFHEITHGYNNSPLTTDGYGDGGPFWAYTEGLADAVRIGAGFHKTRQPDVNGSRQWLGGYTTTGFFLHYVKETHDAEFIPKFNQSARDLGNYTWSFDKAFRSILGRGVQDLWNEYRDFINNGGQLNY